MSGSPSPEPYPGNAYPKYDSGNPLVRRLMDRFFAALDELADAAAPADLLDVGCGEGIVSGRLAARLGVRVVGLDRDVPKLREAWAGRRDVELVTGDARALAFPDDAFDVVTLIEMLQLVDDAPRALAEAARVARRALIVTTPREPLWRMLNVARGAYVRQRGNTPGHVHHWSRRGLISLLRPYGHVELVRTPVPWTLALVRLG